MIKKTVVVLLVLMLMLCFGAAAEETVTLSADKTEYLFGEDIEFTLSAPAGTDYRITCGNTTYNCSVTDNNNTTSLTTLNMDAGSFSISAKYKLPDETTWQESNSVNITVVKYGDAAITASLSAEEIEQGGELFLNAASMEHVRSIRVIVQKKSNSQDVYQREYNVSGQSSAQIRLVTNVISPGEYRIWIVAYGELGYSTVYYSDNFLTVVQNPTIDDTVIYIDCPDEIQVGENTLITATATNATISMKMEYQDEIFGTQTTGGNCQGSGTGFYMATFFFDADHTGPAVLKVTATVGGESKTETRNIMVTGGEGLKITNIEMPDYVWKGRSFEIYIPKPSRAEKLSVSLSIGNNTQSSGYLTGDFRQTITAEQTSNVDYIYYNAYAYYKGEQISWKGGSAWVEDPEDKGQVRFYGQQTVREKTIQREQTITITFESTCSSLEAANWVIDGVEDDAITNLGDGAWTNREFSWDQGGTHTVTAKMKIYGDWVTLSPLTIHVDTPEPTDTSDPTETPAGTTTAPTATPAPSENPVVTTTPPPTAPTVADNYSDPAGTGTYSINADGTATFRKSASSGKVTIPATVKAANGVEAPVTSIADNAFKNDKKLKTVTIGANVQTIGSKAFADCKALTTVTIGKNVKTIGKNAFAGCKTLKTVKGGANVEAIKDSAFSGCEKLSKLPTFKKLKTIGATAFKGCKALTKITIEAKVSAIGKNAFNGCEKLKTITIKSTLLTKKSVKAGAFKGINAKATVKCPKKKLADYKKFLNSKGVPKTAKIK